MAASKSVTAYITGKPVSRF